MAGCTVFKRASLCHPGEALEVDIGKAFSKLFRAKLIGLKGNRSAVVLDARYNGCDYVMTDWKTSAAAWHVRDSLELLDFLCRSALILPHRITNLHLIVSSHLGTFHPVTATEYL